MKSAPSHFTDEETSAQTFSIWLNSCAKVLRLANGGGLGSQRERTRVSQLLCQYFCIIRLPQSI